MAAKIFNHFGDEEVQENIRNEFFFLKNFSHRDIVKAFELIEAQKRSIIIMEYVEGLSLNKLKN